MLRCQWEDVIRQTGGCPILKRSTVLRFGGSLVAAGSLRDVPETQPDAPLVRRLGDSDLICTAGGFRQAAQTWVKLDYAGLVAALASSQLPM